MADTTSSAAPGNAVAPVLELAHASFRYTEAPALALAEIDLVLRPGEMIAVLGPQGAGTSSLCRLVAGVLSDRGSVAGRIALSGSAAMLGDDPEAQITGMTSFVDDEVRLPTRLSGSRRPVDTSAALAELGMARLSGRRLDALSGGERQLVALASLMTLRPAVLVLDQPALSLDPTARQLLRHALDRFRDGGGAVLLAGHQHDELSAAADRVAFLNAGRLTSESACADIDDAVLAARGVWNALAPGDPAPSGDSTALRQLGMTPVDEPAALRLRGLGIARGGSPVFTGFDLDVAPGTVVAVAGANGAGKSTLLRGIAGLLGRDAVVSGEICVAGASGEVRRIAALPAHLRARCVAWVGQDPGAQLSATTALGELERSSPLPPHRRRERPRVRAERSLRSAELLERVGLAAHADDHPYDLTPDQRKDLVIASALLLEPHVLLLDEPTLGRDLAGMRRLERVIRECTEAGGAVVLTTHDLRWAGRVAAAVVSLGE